MAFSQTLFHTKFIAENTVGWNLGELCPKEYFFTAKVVSCQLFR